MHRTQHVSPPRQGPRVRAPELRGRAWLNTPHPDLRLADLRGKIVLIDFWAFCCVNCLHLLNELRPVEERHADVLVVVGVHSPKFVHEADPEALAAAVERYEVNHPVLDDPDLQTWRQYAVRAWPTLVVVDPEGYVVAQMTGEGHAHAVDRIVTDLVAEHEAKGTLHRGSGPFVPPPPPDTQLRFPGKVAVLPDGRFVVSDSRHHSLAVLSADGETVVARVGDGVRGLVDGGAAEARFSEPQGVGLLPPDVAARVGYDLVVADTVNHALRGVRLGEPYGDGPVHVHTIAGTGQQWRPGSPTSGPARNVDLSSPWDVAWFGGRVVVAMAGVHQLWAFDPGAGSGDAGTVEVIAGTTNEGLVDGPAVEAWMAQPSGLASSDDGNALWVADSETSSLRRLQNGELHTAVGRGLFDFGHRDGPATDALFQHPLGVTALPDGSVAVADTYNDALRRYDPATGEVSTLATGLREPSDAVVVNGELVVVESAAHRLTRIRLPDEATRVVGEAHQTQRPATDVAPGDVALDVVFTPPPGQKLDERYGPATRLVVSASPPELLVQGAGTDTALSRSIVVSGELDGGVLHVSATAASCDDADATEFPACHVHQQDWGVPVRLVDGAPAELTLHLAG